MICECYYPLKSLWNGCSVEKGIGDLGLCVCVCAWKWLLCMYSARGRSKYRENVFIQILKFPAEIWNCSMNMTSSKTQTDLKLRWSARKGEGRRKRVANNLVFKKSACRDSSFPPHSSEENRSDCHPADSGSFHFQARLIHYKAIRVPELSVCCSSILTKHKCRNCWLWEFSTDLITVEVTAKCSLLVSHFTPPLCMNGSMCLDSPLIQHHNKLIPDKGCSLISLCGGSTYSTVRSPFWKVKVVGEHKMRSHLEESAVTRLNTILGQTLELSAECRSDGAPSTFLPSTSALKDFSSACNAR